MSEPSDQNPEKPPAPKQEGPGGSDPRRFLSSPMMLVLILVAIGLAIFAYSSSAFNAGSTVPYSFFFQELQTGNVEKVVFQGPRLTGKWKKIPEKVPQGFEGKLAAEFNTGLPPETAFDTQLLPELDKQKVNYGFVEVRVINSLEILSWFIMPLLLMMIIWTVMRRSSDPFSSGGMMGGFIRSPAKRFEKNEKAVTFNEVAGLKSAKQDLQEVVDFLKNPKRFSRLGAKIPKGVLLVGPPGTGKTLMARATAGEAGVPFFSINGSEFIQMFVGVGATRVRDLFKTAREAAPCIIFIDEIDSVGRVRGAGVGGGHDEREQTLNQILSEMDGFSQGETVIVLAATNRADVLDPALLRPGRFDRHVTVDLPARDGRLGILKVHTRKVPLADDVDLDQLAKTTMGYSGAELEKLVNEAALKAARDDKRAVEMKDFLYAQDIVTMGARAMSRWTRKKRR